MAMPKLKTQITDISYYVAKVCR